MEHFFIQAYIAGQIMLLSILVLPFGLADYEADIFALPWSIIFLLFWWDLRQLYLCSWWASFALLVGPAPALPLLVVGKLLPHGVDVRLRLPAVHLHPECRFRTIFGRRSLALRLGISPPVLTHASARVRRLDQARAGIYLSGRALLTASAH